MTYDHWKTTNPEDEFLGPNPFEEDEDAMADDPKSLDGYQYAVLTVDRAEGNGEVGTQWQDTWIVPLGKPIREALREIFGDPLAWPKGRVCITVPEVLPFTPSSAEREYDPDVAPCDDAEFGMKP